VLIKHLFSIIIELKIEYNNQPEPLLSAIEHFNNTVMSKNERKMKMGEKQDRRVRKTKQILRESLITLMKEKSISEITVREISELADINRGTFYLHYQDIYDMVTKVQDEIFDEFNSIVNARSPEEIKNETVLILEDIYSYLADNEALCSVLLSSNGDIAFLERLRSAVREKCIYDFDTVFNKNKSQYFECFASFIVAGSIGLIQEWFNTGMKESPHEMARITNDIIVQGVGVLR
jgi:AcrR family transcriptional regulator